MFYCYTGGHAVRRAGFVTEYGQCLKAQCALPLSVGAQASFERCSLGSPCSQTARARLVVCGAEMPLAAARAHAYVRMHIPIYNTLWQNRARTRRAPTFLFISLLAPGSIGTRGYFLLLFLFFLRCGENLALLSGILCRR